MFPTGLPADRKPSPFLCLRRGVSPGKVFLRDLRHFSLPTQRCFLPWTLNRWSRRLFSAYAEVFPLLSAMVLASASFLCLRRGVSNHWNTLRSGEDFSLPTQRCFCLETDPCLTRNLFSAYAEVFPSTSQMIPRSLSFLCLRRGVSRSVLNFGI